MSQKYEVMGIIERTWLNYACEAKEVILSEIEEYWYTEIDGVDVSLLSQSELRLFVALLD